MTISWIGDFRTKVNQFLTDADSAVDILHTEYVKYLNEDYVDLKSNFDDLLIENGDLDDMMKSFDNLFKFLQDKAEAAYSEDSIIYQFIQNNMVNINNTFDETYELLTTEMSGKLDGITSRDRDVDSLYRGFIEDIEELRDGARGTKGFVLVALDLLTQISGVDL